MDTPLFLFAIALICALITSVYFTGGILLCLGLIVLGSGLFFLLRKKIPYRYALLLLVFALGFGYGEFREALLPENPFIGTEEAELVGVVTEDPRENENSLRFSFKVESVNGEALPDAVSVQALCPLQQALNYGDKLYLQGSFLSSEVLNEGSFDYETYLSQKNLYGNFSAMYNGRVKKLSSGHGHFLMYFAYGMKHRFEAALAYLPAAQQTVIRGIFFGDTSGMDYHTADILTKSGIRHCFAVSGLHVGYVLLLLNAFGSLLRLGRKGRCCLIFPCLFLYAAMTGFSPSVLRASVMCLMVLGTGLYGREPNSFNGLGAAAILLLLINPQMLLQAGFQMSFIAILSILLFLPWLERLVKVDFFGRGGLLVTVAAQVGMIPILAYMFHVVSIVSFFVSTVCCLLVGIMVILCFMALLIAIISPTVGAFVLIPCGLLGSGIIKAMSFCLELPFAYLYKGDFGLLLLLLFYAVLIFLVVFPPLKKRKYLGAMLMLCAFVLFLLPSSGKSEQLEITFLAVGEGDAAYIHTPDGRDIMLDAGDKKNGSVTYYTIRPFLLARGVNDLEAVIVSHNDDDHSGGVPELAGNFPIETLYLPVVSESGFRDLENAVKADNTETVYLTAGDRIDLGAGVTMEILWPTASAKGDDNALSLVAKIRYGDFSTLFTGDIDGDAITALKTASADLEADILKIPHHGSKYSYDEEFYEAVGADAAIISVGKNSYGHPDKKIINYFKNVDTEVYRTDTCGAVTVTSDGSGYEITTFQ